jgi:hypothetical protein
VAANPSGSARTAQDGGLEDLGEAGVPGAMGLVLDGHFPDQGGRYVALGRQAGESRIYAGIH